MVAALKSSIPAELNPDADRRRRKPRSDRRLEESFPVPTGGDGGFIPGAERCASRSQHSRRRRLVVLGGGRVEVQAAAAAASIQAATALKLPIHYLLHLFLILSLFFLSFLCFRSFLFHLSFLFPILGPSNWFNCIVG